MQRRLNKICAYQEYIPTVIENEIKSVCSSVFISAEFSVCVEAFLFPIATAVCSVIC